MTKIATLFFTFFICSNLISQEKSDPKTQPTNFLSKSYYSINFGGIFYPFSNQNLIDGYTTETFSRNYFSGRMLLGYKIQPDLAVQFGTIRPAEWFKYDNVNNIADRTNPIELRTNKAYFYEDNAQIYHGKKIKRIVKTIL